MTSIVSGMPPGEHGVIGYRMSIEGHVLNVLRWSTADGDARRSMPPGDFQLYEPFGGQRPPVVTKAEFAQTGFGKLRGNRPEIQQYVYGKIYNAKAYNACSQMPRFGHTGTLNEQQIKDLVALLLDPASPVNQ